MPNFADWSDEQLAPLERIGNVRSNEFYEAKLPIGTSTALTDSYVASHGACALGINEAARAGRSPLSSGRNTSTSAGSRLQSALAPSHLPHSCDLPTIPRRAD